jgi:hypothetical protein
MKHLVLEVKQTKARIVILQLDCIWTRNDLKQLRNRRRCFRKHFIFIGRKTSSRTESSKEVRMRKNLLMLELRQVSVLEPSGKS